MLLTWKPWLRCSQAVVAGAIDVLTVAVDHEPVPLVVVGSAPVLRDVERDRSAS